MRERWARHYGAPIGAHRVHLTKQLEMQATTGLHRRPIWVRLSSSWQIRVCLIILAIASVAAVFAPIVSPADPSLITVAQRLQPPDIFGTHMLGTDHLGRDIASRMLFGARVSLGVAVAVVVLSGVFGILIGLAGGYAGRLGESLMRVVDGMLAFPEIVVALALIAALGSSVINVILALVFVFMPRFARVVHAAVLSLQNRENVLAAHALGCSRMRIVFRHLLPQTAGLLIVQATFIFAYAIIFEASLTFLGVGLPPGSASWGAVLSDGRDHLIDAPWITIVPGVAIFVLVLCLNILGDRIRDINDPHSIEPPARGDFANGTKFNR